MRLLKYFLATILMLMIFALPIFADDTIANEDSTKQEAATDNTEIVTAYYFYTTKRCPSCKKIEKYSHEAIESGFSEMLESGALVWKMVNTDEEDNEHFVEDYGLYTKSLIISRSANDVETEWVNLTKVWELLNSEADFKEYVVSEIQTFLDND